VGPTPVPPGEDAPTGAEPPERRPALTDLPVDGYDALAALPGARRYTPGSVRRWVLRRGSTSLPGTGGSAAAGWRPPTAAATARWGC
jgi:hypothetical protein